ncbi:YibE/F family protein [Paucilactobacillus kaifaensis]|uniref:YibE/F family protein n=1 Tax=Paucilactobacillus kaifaensis TaxID=2559921 RepID=UPI001CC3DAEE|nr:YibE/F family protein [Paucilactobacillus kaifaensis]
MIHEEKKRTIWLAIILIVLGIGSMLFVTHNQLLYKQPLVQVVRVTNSARQKQKDNFDNVDHLTSQKLTVKVLNGKFKHQQLVLTNQFSDSGGLDQKYKIGDQVFVNLHQNSHQRLSGTISGYKRDGVLVFLVWLVVALLILIMRKKGSLAFLSVLLNGVVFFIAIQIDLSFQGEHVMLIFSVLSLLFATMTLLLVLGLNRQMLATLGATVIGTSIAMLISLAVFHLTHERGMFYESMQYVTQVPRPLFLAETLLGSLGAVMDESTDIVATLFELKSLDPNVSAKKLFLSGRKVGQTIMGPLVNVLFMIFMADTFTSSLLYIKNGNSWGYTFAMNMSLGTVQSLISGIGIVLAIPVASALAGLLLGKRVKA